MHKKLKGIVWILVIAIVAVGFSPTVHLLVKYTPWSVEEKLEKQLMAGYQPDVCELNTSDSKNVWDKFKKRIFPIMKEDKDVPITFTFVKNDQINAYATVGGKIFINSALLNFVETPEELAGVLSHEVAHVTERHILGAILTRILFANTSDGAAMFFHLGFSVGEEAAADSIGIDRMKKSQIDLNGFLSFFKKLEKMDGGLSIISDHPGTKDRMKKVQERSVLKYTSIPILTNDEWKILKNICK